MTKYVLECWILDTVEVAEQMAMNHRYYGATKIDVIEVEVKGAAKHIPNFKEMDEGTRRPR